MIKVVRNPRCNPEEFRLSGSADAKNLQLDCGSGAAFIYAVGKLLRSGRYADVKEEYKINRKTIGVD